MNGWSETLSYDDNDHNGDDDDDYDADDDEDDGDEDDEYDGFWHGGECSSAGNKAHCWWKGQSRHCAVNDENCDGN